MLTKFKQHFTKLVKEQQGKMTLTIDKDDNLTNIDNLRKLLDKLAIVDLVYFDVQMHFYLIETITDIYRISKKAKLKAKALDQFVGRVYWLQQWLTDHQDKIEDKLIRNTIDTDLYTLPSFAKNAVYKHLNLLLSKTVDYLPHEGSVKTLDPFMTLMNSYRDELLGYIDGECHWWVYPFTDNNHLFPLRLQVLNQFDKLGVKMETWLDYGYENKYVKYINDQGYDIFGGWGNLQANVTVTEQVVKKTDKAKQTPPEGECVTLTKDRYNALVDALYRYSFMYLINTSFNIRDINHAQMYYCSLTTCLYYAGSGRMVQRKQVVDAVREARTMLNKSQKMRLRKDRKYWLVDDMADGLLRILETFIQDRVNMITAMVATHCCDLCIPSDDDWVEVVKKHHEYCARSRVEITYKGREYSEEEIKRIVDLYQRVHVKQYELFIPDNQLYLFQISLEYWLNIRDVKRVEVAYEQLKQWFGVRHTIEENKHFHDDSWIYYLFLSHYNKRHLLEKLEKEPIDIINYGGARNTYKAIINLLNNELNQYDLLYRSLVEDNEVTVEHDNTVSLSKQPK